MGKECDLIVVLICLFLITIEAEYFIFLAIVVFSFVNCLFMNFAHFFFTVLFVFYLVICKSYFIFNKLWILIYFQLYLL